MTLRTETCNFRLVSKSGQSLIIGDDAKALLSFTRAILACPRLRGCSDGDCCTIFSASLLCECARSHSGA